MIFRVRSDATISCPTPPVPPTTRTTLEEEDGDEDEDEEGENSEVLSSVATWAFSSLNAWLTAANLDLFEEKMGQMKDEKQGAVRNAAAEFLGDFLWEFFRRERER